MGGAGTCQQRGAQLYGLHGLLRSPMEVAALLQSLQPQGSGVEAALGTGPPQHGAAGATRRLSQAVGEAVVAAMNRNAAAVGRPVQGLLANTMLCHGTAYRE